MDVGGFSSPRPDSFPAGLRVLVVDDDATWLKILEKMLKKCNYEVTTCNLGREALDLLRERKDGFDIVISDVNMPDMDGFELLEHVGLKMDLPVIMMSVDGETSRVMKGVQHGACDYLLKPIRMKELRNIWQHVFRKRLHEVRDIEGHENLEEIQTMRNGTEQSDDGFLFNGDPISGRKRKDADRLSGDPSSSKKARVVWTVDLHQKFVKAVNQIGFEKVGPKKILDLMGIPWLTRENVASHLQKYRLYLSRLQQENELKAAFGGIKHSDISSRDPTGNVCHQNSIAQNTPTVLQKIVKSESYTAPRQNVLIHNDDSKICGRNIRGIVSMPMEESKKALLGDVIDPLKSRTSRISFRRSYSTLDSEMKSVHKIQAQYSWTAEVPPIQFKQEHKPHFQSERRFDHFPLSIHHKPVDTMESNILHNPSPKEADESTLASYKHSNTKSRNLCIGSVTQVENVSGLLSVQPQRQLTDCRVFDPVPCSTWSIKNHALDQNLFDVLSQRNLVVGTGSPLRLWDEEFDAYSSEVEPFGCLNQELIAADVPPHLYDSSSFDSEYLSDPVEYPVMDKGLFILHDLY